jgi:hypothetical protein
VENSRQICWHRTPVALECTWKLWLSMLDWAHSPTVFPLQHFFCQAPDVLCLFLPLISMGSHPAIPFFPHLLFALWTLLIPTTAVLIL